MKIVFAGEGDWLVNVLIKQKANYWLRSYYALQHKTDPGLAEVLPLQPVRSTKPVKRRPK